MWNERLRRTGLITSRNPSIRVSSKQLLRSSSRRLFCRRIEGGSRASVHSAAMTHPSIRSIKLTYSGRTVFLARRKERGNGILLYAYQRLTCPLLRHAVGATDGDVGHRCLSVASFRCPPSVVSNAWEPEGRCSGRDFLGLLSLARQRK